MGPGRVRDGFGMGPGWVRDGSGMGPGLFDCSKSLQSVTHESETLMVRRCARFDADHARIVPSLTSRTRMI